MLNWSMLSLLHLAAAVIVAQSSPVADQLYLSRDYAHAASAYRTIVQAEPQNAQAWYRLGVSLQQTGVPDEAMIDYQRALSLGFDAFSVYYRMATLEVGRNHASAAVADLDKAAGARFSSPQTFADDEALKPLVGTPEFTAFLARADASFYPCKHDARYRALDFWVGDWDVWLPDGSRQLGSSHVGLDMHDCVVVENWTGSIGGTGKSFSEFDIRSGKWIQHWVDSFGASTDYQGTIVGSSVQMIANTPSKKDPHGLTRLTFSPMPDGIVRQLFETSSDGGKTWLQTFDGRYRKVKP